MQLQLSDNLIEKPWGRTDIPSTFCDTGTEQIDEIW